MVPSIAGKLKTSYLTIGKTPSSSPVANSKTSHLRWHACISIMCVYIYIYFFTSENTGVLGKTQKKDVQSSDRQ